jgi:glycerophosphoryl diester phosphodiesterase
VIAHRGASTVEYQNSLAAFRAAVAAGADGIELDVHATVDGALIVHHDPDVDGVHIASATARDVRAGHLPNGETPPTLAEALTAAGALRVYIEIKTLPPRWDAELLRAIDEGPNPAGYAVHAFDHRILQRLGAVRPNLPRGALSASYPVRPLMQLQDTGARTLWQETSLIDADLTRMMHAADMQVIAWTADAPDEMKRLISLGIDGICTNDPQRGRAIVATA